MRDAEVVNMLHRIDELQKYRLDEIIIADVGSMQLYHVENIPPRNVIEKYEEKIIFLDDSMVRYDVRVARDSGMQLELALETS